MSDTLVIELEGGKYSYVYTNGKQTVLRHDEEWRDLTGDKFVYAMAARIAELEAALNNILSCHRNAMMDPRLFSALIPDFVLEEAYGVLKKEWVKEQPDAALGEKK